MAKSFRCRRFVVADENDLLAQLQRRVDATGDARLGELLEELRGYPGVTAGSPSPTDVVLPLRYRRGERELSLFSISAVVGTATDVTVEELAIEAFYPADEATAAAVRALEQGGTAAPA